jgi:transposase InsO family protein
LIHTDLYGPTSTQSPRGERYFILLIDDYTRMAWVGLLKHKFEAFEEFKIFKAQVENETDLKIKCLRLDRGGEFSYDEFNSLCKKHGIKRQFSISRTPQQNGVMERMNIIVQEMSRAMLDESKVPITFWG